MKMLRAVGLFLLLCACSHNYSVALKDGEELTEGVALRISIEALEDAGVDVAQLTPFPYGKSTSVFARNTLNPNEGYVLWRPVGDEGHAYSVSIEVMGKRVVCQVSRAK
jgi:hypothetical protein